MAKPLPPRHHTHDRLVRLYFEDPALFADFLRHYGDQVLVPKLNLAKLRPEDPAVISGDLSQRIGDLRYRCVFKGSVQPVEVFIFFEHQSTAQLQTPLRILRNIADAYIETLKENVVRKPPPPLPYPLAIILYHGKMPWKGALNVRDFVGMVPGVNRHILDFPLILVDLARIPSERLTGSPVLLAILDALRSTSQGRLVERFPIIMEMLADSGNNEMLRDRMDAMVHYVAAHCDPPNGEDVVRGVYSRAFNPREGDKMAKTWMDRILEEGEAKGREEGREEGVAMATLSVLATRFGSVPATVRSRVMALSDPEELDRLTVRAVTCGSIKEFKSALDEIKTKPAHRRSLVK